MVSSIDFILSSALLGVGLAMDAFSVSLANGLNEPGMKKGKMSLVAGTFAFFQFLMPMIGWICVHSLTQYFSVFMRFVPWIALTLLLFIGGKMIVEGIKGNEDGEVVAATVGAVFIQGIATSIDALSVGFTIASYDTISAFVASAIIAVVTFIICIAGLMLGKKFGMKLSNKAQIFGGTILVIIGIKIFVESFL